MLGCGTPLNPSACSSGTVSPAATTTAPSGPVCLSTKPRTPARDGAADSCGPAAGGRVGLGRDAGGPAYCTHSATSSHGRRRKVGRNMHYAMGRRYIGLLLGRHPHCLFVCLSGPIGKLVLCLRGLLCRPTCLQQPSPLNKNGGGFKVKVTQPWFQTNKRIVGIGFSHARRGRRSLAQPGGQGGQVVPNNNAQDIAMLA